jgi:hypothetical protein
MRRLGSRRVFQTSTACELKTTVLYAGVLKRKLARANLRLRLLSDGVKGHAFFTVGGTGLVTSWNRVAVYLADR